MSKFKKVILALVLMVVLNSCTKSTNSSSSSNFSGRNPVSKLEIKGKGWSNVYQCSYDSINRLTNCSEINYDSTNLTQSETINYVFSYNGTDSNPVSYTLIDKYYSNNVLQTSNEQHLVYYDAQNRVTKDSVVNGYLLTANYTYSGNMAVINYSGHADSFYYSNQNIIRTAYISGGVTMSFNNNTYTNYINPVYGYPAFLFIAGGFVSKNFPATEVGNDGLNDYSGVYNYTLDNNGRIIKGIETKSDGSVVTTNFYY